MQDAYDWIAGWYDTLIEPALAGLRRSGLAMYPPRPGMKVLDAACGTGTHLALYRARGCSVHGADVSKAMLAAARKRLGVDVPLHLADAARLPFASASFDLVLFSMALHEFDRQTRAAALEEARRVVRPNGRVLVLDYSAGAVSFPVGWCYLAGITCVEWLAGSDHFRHQREYVAAGGIPQLIRQHSLAIDRMQTFRGGTFGVYLLRLQ